MLPRFKIQYPMKNRGKDAMDFWSLQALFNHFLRIFPGVQ